MKLTKEDFRPFSASCNEIWIEKRIFKRKYSFFGEYIPTNKFGVLVSGETRAESSPINFLTIDDMDSFIEENFEKINKVNIFRYNDL